MDRITYLDYAATTPVDERVVDAMLPFLAQRFGNPNSLYSLGRDAYTALEASRESVAASLGASHPSEVLFTSCGTESDNTALIGIASAMAERKGRHIVVSAFEHHAVLEPAHWLEKRGFSVTYLKPQTDGVIDPDALAEAMRDETCLVSIMHANNEIGTVQRIRALVEIAHARGAYFHTDACQTLGKMDFNVEDLGVDAASFSGHKIYAPKGTGVLYLRRGTRFQPYLMGGGQEFKKRSGTQNVAGAVAFATALRIMDEERPLESPRLASLRDRLVSAVLEGIENTELNGSLTERLPNIANFIIKGVEGEAMLLQLDAKGISVSTGSACSSGSLEPSHVLLSIGCPPELAHGSLRVSIGRFTTEADIDYLVDCLTPIVERLRSMSPVYAKMFPASR